MSLDHHFWNFSLECLLTPSGSWSNRLHSVQSPRDLGFWTQNLGHVGLISAMLDDSSGSGWAPANTLASPVAPSASQSQRQQLYHIRLRLDSMVSLLGKLGLRQRNI